MLQKQPKIFAVWNVKIIDHRTVNRWLKKIHSGYKNLNNQEESGKPKTGFWDCAPTNRGKSEFSLRVRGELGISESSVVYHLQVSGTA